MSLITKIIERKIRGFLKEVDMPYNEDLQLLVDFSVNPKHKFSINKVTVKKS